MIADVVLVNAKAYLDGALTDCSLALDEGRVLKVGRETNMPRSDVKFDLKGLLVLPGLVDSHVHLRDEEKAYKEDFFSGTAAASAGGVTTVLDMPNNEPVTMSVAALRNRMEVAENRVLVNVGFFSEFPKDKSEIGGIVGEGAVGFKLYMAEQIGGLDVGSDEAIAEAFKVTADLGVLTAVHAEDGQTLKRNVERFRSIGQNDLNAFLKAHSAEVEVKAVERLLKLARTAGARLHFCHASTGAGLKAVAEAKKAGATVTCEVTPHNLLLSQEDLRRIGTLTLTMPPVRERSDMEALWEGVRNSEVDTVGSDHAPHARREKEAESVWDVKVGIPGLETSLPLLLTAVHRGRLSLGDLVRLVCERPAEIFGLKGRGRLKERNEADLTAVDFKRRYRIDASEFRSKAKFSPFDGWEVVGKPVKTFVAGRLVMDGGDIVAKPGTGRVIRRG